jgi:hypothetical protein
MDSHRPNGFGTHLDQSFFDSFRWLDEEEDLDLRLFLDDYHAHLREGAPTTKQRPSFRRRMSITKIPFGRRSSVSSGRPGTKDATIQSPPPIRSPAGSVSNGLTQARRKSRALSLITPKHAPQPSITAFDPSPAHYQDPEARLKLRVYLASPQKFDEAVAFGFPSDDAVSPPDAGKVSRRQSRQKLADGSSSNMRTFWTDDDDDNDNEEPGDILSLSSDQPSSPDLDYPKTPEPQEQQQQQPPPQRARLTRHHARLASAGGALGGRKTPDGSREMTLRMTLTRPDLRAHEEDIYGWQQRMLQQRPAYQQHSRRPTAMAALAGESRGASSSLGNGSRQGSLEKFPEMDPWGGLAAERGVMRRIWDRVRRG